MNDIIKNIINGIKPLDKEAMKRTTEYQLSLAKPPRSLGKLEDISIKLSGITGKVHNKIDKCCILVFASDNGVYAEGVSTTPQSVTYQQAINLTRGLTGAATLAKHFNDDLFVYDVGVIGNLDGTKVVNNKIRSGTSNIKIGPAMSYDEAIEAFKCGINAVRDHKDDYDIFGIGEMGIGNTTTSSAVLSVLTQTPAVDVTGKGAGLSDEEYLHKIDVINEAIRINKPNKDDVIDILSKVGGFDLCAMTGAYLACAYYKKPVVIDGFISIVAALCAHQLNNEASSYFFASHKSYEKGYNIALEKMHLDYLFDLNMRLGEGSGCPIAFNIIQASLAITNEMATFDEASINDDYVKEIADDEHYTIKKDN